MIRENVTGRIVVVDVGDWRKMNSLSPDEQQLDAEKLQKMLDQYRQSVIYYS